MNNLRKNMNVRKSSMRNFNKYLCPYKNNYYTCCDILLWLFSFNNYYIIVQSSFLLCYTFKLKDVNKIHS